jgi:CBS domain-containing protein
MSGPSGFSGDRSPYLLDGRRVTLADLIDAGLLAAGTRLRFDRVRLGETHYAKVTTDGQIALEDGLAYRSPSRAAVVAAGVRALDGWHAWIVDSSGRTLDSLRQELLDQAAAQPARGEEAAEQISPDPRRRHEFLKEARAKANRGEPREIAVRDLLSLWNADARDNAISQRVEADLANHDLVTTPNFWKVTLDSVVQLAATPETAGSPQADSDEAEEPEEPRMGLTVGNLPSALGGVVSVLPTASIEEAITTMLLNDYSQLAVLSGPRNLRGAVTWKSIAQARHANPSAVLAAAITEAHAVPYDRELIDVLRTLEESDFVFVSDVTKTVAGIITTADVVHAYGELATPFFLIGELDRTLRYIISKAYDIDQVVTFCSADGSRVVESCDSLSMGDYKRILENPEMWAKLGWPLDRAIFIKRLDELREIRNKVMHFNPDPLPPKAVGRLRSFLQLLHEYGD